MIKVSMQEALKIAEMSRISVCESELAQITQNLEIVLSYAERVQELAAAAQEPSSKNVNIEREDVIVRTDSEQILAQAPCREENYFVVPVIIEGK